MTVQLHWVLVLLCLYSGAVYSNSISISSSSSSTYTVPICQGRRGFYCPEDNGYSCPPRTDRCTGDLNDPLCIRKTYRHCGYNPATGKFKVYRHSTDLQIFGKRRRNCFRHKLKHHFITYRGLMYEFGDYGSRVQDPNDPKYEYNKRSSTRKYVGESNCTYQQVRRSIDVWMASDYRLCGNNCQDFADRLQNMLVAGCSEL